MAVAKEPFSKENAAPAVFFGCPWKNSHRMLLNEAEIITDLPSRSIRIGVNSAGLLACGSSDRSCLPSAMRQWLTCFSPHRLQWRGRAGFAPASLATQSLDSYTVGPEKASRVGITNLREADVSRACGKRATKSKPFAKTFTRRAVGNGLLLQAVLRSLSHCFRAPTTKIRREI